MLYLGEIPDVADPQGLGTAALLFCSSPEIPEIALGTALQNAEIPERFKGRRLPTSAR